MKKIFVLVASLFMMNCAFGQLLQMEPLAGPEGFLAENFAINHLGEILTDSHPSGLHLTKDGGATWETVVDDYNKNYTLEAHPDGDFIIIQNTLLLRYNSTTSALDTINSNVSLGDRVSLKMLENGTLFMMKVDGKIYESIDKGEIWTLFHDYGYSLKSSSFLTEVKGKNELITAIDTTPIGSAVNTLIHHFDIDSRARISGFRFFSLATDVVFSNNEYLIASGNSIRDRNFNALRSFSTYVLDLEDLGNGELLAIETEGIHRSSDNGISWVKIPSPMKITNSFFYRRVSLDPTSDTWIFNFHTNSTSTLHRASKDFSTWTPIYREGAPVKSIEMLQNDSLIIEIDQHSVLNVRERSYHISSNSANSFRTLRINGSIGINHLAQAEMGNFIAVADDKSLYKSTDYGLNWSLVDLGLEVPQFVHGNKNGVFVVEAEGEKLLYSSDYGDTWELISENIKPHAITISSTGVVYGFLSTNVLRSDEFQKYNATSQQWETVFQFDVSARHLAETFGNYVFAVSEKNGREIRIVSDDDFQTYYQVDHEFNFLNEIKHLKNDLIYSLTFPNTLQISQNQGLTWTSIAQLDFDLIGRIESATLDENNFLYLGVEDNVIYKSTTPIALFDNFIEGKVYFDKDANCQFDSADVPMPNAIVQAAGVDTFYVTVPSNGEFSMPVAAGSYEVSVLLSDSLWQMCNPPQTVTVSNPNETANVDLPVIANADCPQLQVYLSTPFLRRCFVNRNYVSYQNNGSQKAENAYVEITLDSRFQIDSSSIPFTSQMADSYIFDIGDIDVFEQGKFYFYTSMDCDSVSLDETICAEARIFPDSICYQPTNWSGAILEAGAQCTGDSITFTIENVGSGDMVASRQAVIIEDLIIMRVSPPFKLNAGETLIQTMFADGKTFHMGTQQDDNYPGLRQIGATVERCGMPPYSVQLFNQFIQQGNTPAHDIECRVVRGSYDPNDKSAIPTGIGMEHSIQPNTNLEYLIRFQNTGTDTAFTVVIIDTLSHLLDLSTLKIGSASHDFTHEVYENGILRFDFNNIMLPDSNVNEAASNGFVKYTIALKSDAPIGSTVYNAADIYFDFNDPIFTNQTYHLIDQPWVTVKTDETFVPDVEVNVFPNPFAEQATFDLKNAPFGEKQFRLFSLSGNEIHSQTFDNQQFVFNRGHLPKGIYVYQISKGGMKISAGKLIVQ